MTNLSEHDLADEDDHSIDNSKVLHQSWVDSDRRNIHFSMDRKIELVSMDFQEEFVENC